MTKPRLKDADLQQAVDAVAAHGNQSAASRALGIVRETFVRRYWVAVNRGFKPQVQALIAGERAAPTDGYGVSKVTTTFDKDGEIEKQWVGLSVKDAKSREMGEDAPMPEGQILKGLSTLYDGNGRITQQWVKTKTDLEAQLQASLEAIRSVFEEVTPLDPIAAPEHCNSRLLTVYPIGDHHVGMKAWGEETGTDYDMKIAERLLTSAAAHLVEVSPPSETALVINLGDLYHVDNLKNQTSRSGNVLDVDGRYAAMIRAGVKVMRVVIEKALAKHTQVKVICVIGNHDDVGAMWLQLALSLFYENNPRVTVETKPGKFHYHQHGKVLIGTTHGDTGKPEKLSGVMAADMPQMWGETAFRYWFTGHVHSRKVIEFPGVMWETFRTLAPNDAYSAGAAYRSGRDMTSIVMHEQHGEVARHRFDVSMMDAA